MDILLIMGRMIFASYSNVVQKQLTQKNYHSLTVVRSSYLVLVGLSLPWLFWLDIPAMTSPFWGHILLAALLDAAGTCFLVLSLSRTDLSIFGPLNAYKVVISMLLAMLLLDEFPSLQGITGITIILIGSGFLLPPSSHRSTARLLTLVSERGVQYRFLSLLLFSIGTLPLKNAVVIANPLLTTVFWSIFGCLFIALIHWLCAQRQLISPTKIVHTDYHHCFTLGLTLFLMQLTTLMVLVDTLIAYALALFQLSMVLQVIFGYHLFNEPHFKRRLIACLVMILGSILVLTVTPETVSFNNTLGPQQ